MLPEFEKYLEALESAEQEYETAKKDYAQHYSVRARARDNYQQTRIKLWTQLAVQTDDPLVKWIVHNAPTAHSNATRVLRELPCSLAKLDQVASEQGWCSDWDELRTRAIVDGAVSDGMMRLEVRAYGYGSRGWTPINEWTWPSGRSLTVDQVRPLFVSGATLVQLTHPHGHIMIRLAD